MADLSALDNVPFEQQKKDKLQAKSETAHRKSLAADLRRVAKQQKHAGAVVDLFDREDIPGMATAAAGMVLAQILAGEILLQSRDVSSFLKTTIDLTRLESGETATNETPLSADAERRLIEALRDKADERIGLRVVDAG
jgi:hypothetical protein